MAREIQIGAAQNPRQHSGWPTGPAIYREVFEAIGQPSLPCEVLKFLRPVCDASSVHFFRIDTPQPDITCSISVDRPETASLQSHIYMSRAMWRGDADMAQASMPREAGAITLYRMSAAAAHTSELCDFYRSQRLVERLIVCGPSAQGQVAYSIMRSAPNGELDSHALETIGEAVIQLFPLISKHMEVMGQSRRVVESLTNLALIEGNLAHAAAALPQREIQVAARLLYGLDASCIASDLGIGGETVNTYRKRLYSRLGICCRHELLLWYLRHCGRMVEAGVDFAAEGPRLLAS
jgi:DNA-binding NarL/FixJ family response regulator